MIRDDTTPCYGKSALFDSTNTEAHREARELCATCPAIAACQLLLDDVLKTVRDRDGIEGTWAGRGFRIGKKVGRPSTRQKNRSQRDIPDCGTESAYARHIYRKEDCDICRPAHAVRRRETRRLKAAS